MLSKVEQIKLAIVATHPIQYQAPLWRKLATSQKLLVKVFYASAHGGENSYDKLYEKSFSWDIPLLDGYDFEFLKTIKIMGLPGPVACYYPLGLKKKLDEGKFDAVLIHGYMSGAAWAGYLAGHQLGLPVFIRGDSHLVGRKLNGVRAKMKSLLLGRFLSGISGCIAIGSWNREYWTYYGSLENSICTALFAVDNDRFSDTAKNSKEEVAALRSSWGVQFGDTVFAFSGNLQPHKGVDILIKAFNILRKKRKDVHLVIIGEGPKKDELKENAGVTESIHWMGFVNQSKMPVYLAATDMFVLPSYMEPWGLVVNEAMACGLPCIVSDAVGAGPDLIAEGETGEIVPVGAPRLLAEVMEKACEPSVRKRWKANIPRILKEASYDENVKIIADFINSKRHLLGVRR